MHDDQRRLAEAVRAACRKAAQEAYENAATSGLCEEGAIEVALGAITAINLDAVIAALPTRGDTKLIRRSARSE